MYVAKDGLQISGVSEMDDEIELALEQRQWRFREIRAVVGM